MPAATKPRPKHITDEQLPELLALLKDSDSVELKLTVPESAHYTVAAALDLDPLEAQMRQVFFFDTPDLALNRAGVVVRARRVQRKGGGDSVVKLRPVVPHELADSVRTAEGFATEVDAMPGAFVCSGTLKRPVDNADVRRVVTGKQPLKRLFSKAQRAFLAEHAPDGVGLADLTVLGPILVLKLKFEPIDFEHRLVAELWNYPDGSRVLELSTKCPPVQAFQTAVESRAFLSERGVDLSAEQETKTAKALEYFTSQLRPRRRPGSAGGDS